jgi:hypothetical protein
MIIPMKIETEAQYIEKMPLPRPFAVPRIILARGAVGWFMNLIITLIVALLLTLALSSLSRGSSSISGAAFFIVGSFLLLLVLLIKRIIEPFRMAALLRKGRVGVFSIVKREHSYSVFSRIGSKHQSAYTIRFGETPEDLALIEKFDGTDLYNGDKTVLLYQPRDNGSNGPDQKAVPESFFALDCFLHHRRLTFPDLLEGEEQGQAAELQNREKASEIREGEEKQEWMNTLGSTWPSFLGRFIMTVGILSVIGIILFAVFRM